MKLIESLEPRTLFAGSPVVRAEVADLIAGAVALRGAFARAVVAYHTDADRIQLRIEGLPRTQTNVTDIAKLSKASSATIAVEARDLSKLTASGTADALRVHAAYGANLEQPTAAHSARLAAVLSALQALTTSAELKITSDIATGENNIETALNRLIAANPAATRLAADATQAEDAQSEYFAAIDTGLNTINTEIAALTSTVYRLRLSLLPRATVRAIAAPPHRMHTCVCPGATVLSFGNSLTCPFELATISVSPRRAGRGNRLPAPDERGYSMIVESLEPRTLMAAVPAAYLARYDTLIHDNGVLEAIALQFKNHACRRREAHFRGSQTKWFHESDLVLLKKGEAAGATIASMALSGAKDFAKAAPPVYRAFAAAQTAFQAKPNLANGHRYSHEITAMQTISNYNYSRPIQTIIAKQIDAEDAVQAVLSGLAAAHPGAQPLNADLQTVQTQLSSLPNTLDNEEDAVSTDINTFEEVP